MSTNPPENVVEVASHSLLAVGDGVWFASVVWKVIELFEYDGSPGLTIERRYHWSPNGGWLGSYVRRETHLFPDLRQDFRPLFSSANATSLSVGAKGKPMDKRPHAPDCFCYKCEAEQFSAARAAKEKADDRLALTDCSAWRDPENDPPTKTGKILIWIEGIGPSIVNVEERWMCYWNGNDETEPTAPHEWDWWMEISPPNAIALAPATLEPESTRDVMAG
jgi:hypothetical protein